jgi:hypothetical protein
MDSAKLNDWMQVVGIFAVVASLIFVGLQMKQSQEIAIADQYQDRADAALEFYLARMQSDVALQMSALNIREFIESGRAGDAIRQSLENEGPEMVAMRSMFYRSNITMFDNYHFQYEQGFLMEDAWLGFRVRLKNILANDVSADFYELMRSHFRSSFQAECDQILREIAEEKTQ